MSVVEIALLRPIFGEELPKSFGSKVGFSQFFEIFIKILFCENGNLVME